MITRQHGCRPLHQQDGGVAMVALMRRIARTGFIVGIVVLAVRLLTPGDYLPKVDLWDKLEHGLAFGVVAFTGAVAFPGRPSLLRLGCGLPCLGMLFEIMQILVPGREAAVGDALANTIGVAIGLAPFAIIQLGRIVRGSRRGLRGCSRVPKSEPLLGKPQSPG
jgi:VanZ family protein